MLLFIPSPNRTTILCLNYGICSYSTKAAPTAIAAKPPLKTFLTFAPLLGAFSELAVVLEPVVLATALDPADVAEELDPD